MFLFSSRPRRHLSGILVATLLLSTALGAGVRVTLAQQSYQPGVVGGVAGANPSTYYSTCSPSSACVVYARLHNSSPNVDVTVPLNGNLNYVFYYAPDFFNGVSNVPIPDDSRFLPADTYAVDFENANQFFLQGNGSVSYTHDHGLTTTTGLLTAPLGIQGYVTDTSGRPIQYAVVTLTSSQNQLVDRVYTNGNGFYSFYYTQGFLLNNGQNTYLKSFIPPGTYTVRASTTGSVASTQLGYSPDTTFGTPSYYVAGATAPAASAPALTLTRAPSKSDESFTRAAYQGALGRQPTCDELQVENIILQDARNRDAILDEARRLTVELFQTDASANDPNMADYVQTPEYEARNPANSGRSQEFVTDLYNAILQRTPDPGGLAYWTSQVNTQGRRRVLLAFAASEEFQDLAGTIVVFSVVSCYSTQRCPRGYVWNPDTASCENF